VCFAKNPYWSLTEFAVTIQIFYFALSEGAKNRYHSGVNVFDLIILAILAALTLRGIWKGMVSQIVSVASVFVCWIVATRFGCLVAPTIPVETPWDQVLAMAIVFLLTWIGIRFAYTAIEKLIKDWHLEKLNKLLGGALGFAKGLLLCLIITFFSVMVSETSRDVVFHSKTGVHMVRLITRIGVFVPKDSYEFVHSQLASFQSKVDGAVQGKTPERIAVQSSEQMQQLFGQMQQTTEKIESNTGSANTSSLLTALSKWWNGTKDEMSPVEAVIDAVQTVTEQASREVALFPAATYTPPTSTMATSTMPTMPEINENTSAPLSAVPLSAMPLSAMPQPSVAVEDFFIQRQETAVTPVMQELTPLRSFSSDASVQSSPLNSLAALTPLPETLPIPPEPLEFLPPMPVPNHIGSDLLLRNSTHPAGVSSPASVFRP